MGLFSFLSGKQDGPDGTPESSPVGTGQSPSAVAEPGAPPETPFVRPPAWDMPDLNTAALTAPTEKGSSDGPTVGPADPALTAELQGPIIEVIKTVFDPEIPVNIMELGLVYDVWVDAAGVAGIRMTLTAPGCPAAQSLPVEVAHKVKAVPGVSDAKVDVVWDPPWTKDRMSDAAKLQLGMW